MITRATSAPRIRPTATDGLVEDMVNAVQHILVQFMHFGRVVYKEFQ